MGIKSSLSHFFFTVISIDNSSHDFLHLVLDLLSLGLILDGTTFESTDGDNLISTENLLVVDPVASFFIHEILVGVVKHNADLSICLFLSKESSSMCSYFVIKVLWARNKYLSVIASVYQVIFNKFFDITISLIALKSLNFNQWNDLIVFDQEISECRDCNTVVNLFGINYFLALFRRFSPQFLNLLPHSKETIAKQLINRERHAVVVSSLNKQNLLGSDKLIFIHDFLRVIFCYMIIWIEEASGESARVIDLFILSNLSLFSS